MLSFVSLLKKKKFTSLKILWHHRQKSRLTKGIQHFLFTQFSFFFVAVLNLHDSVMSARKSVGGPKEWREKKRISVRLKRDEQRRRREVGQMKREKFSEITLKEI